MRCCRRRNAVSARSRDADRTQRRWPAARPTPTSARLGATQTAARLARLLGREVKPVGRQYGDPEAPAVVAFIVEELCIGCARCLPACPVDAIVGAARQTHTVIAADCTGCKLCIAPCPVDCIEMRPGPRLPPVRPSPLSLPDWPWPRHSQTGLHRGLMFPADERSRAAGSLMWQALLPDWCCPCQQPHGDALVPCVKAGNPVKLGQVIAWPADDLGAPLHSPVSGRITGMEECDAIGSAHKALADRHRQRRP